MRSERPRDALNKKASSGRLGNYPVDSFPENVRKLSGRVVSNGHSLPCKFWTPQMMSRRVSMGHQNSPVVYISVAWMMMTGEKKKKSANYEGRLPRRLCCSLGHSSGRTRHPFWTQHTEPRRSFPPREISWGRQFDKGRKDEGSG
ncbi:uncharacterized protein PGTG_05112 [Puccinia graminis f. sp. tritici CRL 75-36-700-3]|uniref:Uncharacterized protein n=1 Tax=Puccinia graminis f. sp. tritici (strain CRL 75-36-700-3 / race SCCL) TaxID=418459 RepID=E3K6G5_PUCGT|nr:uncharacterized protein PGTG_05112 [Puccinia graminis f. sp. tritici CRL 75-36-700-3]EFP79887.1 hypothetical protein PGTG_05112 [Puccinia graminis f. sp. tritici CRL 75-36-700-3]